MYYKHRHFNITIGEVRRVLNHCHCKLLRSFFVDVVSRSVPPGLLIFRPIFISSTEAGDIVCRI